MSLFSVVVKRACLLLVAGAGACVYADHNRIMRLLGATLLAGGLGVALPAQVAPVAEVMVPIDEVQDQETSEDTEDLADEAFDPNAGLRDDGGIPPVDVPEVKHPERWRYVPPGRIPPGHIFKRFFVTSFIVPKVEYEEATGLDIGIGVFDSDFRHQKRQEFLGFSASRSTEGQQQYAIIWQRKLAHYELPNGGAYFEERSQVRLAARYEKSLTTRFFGLGPDSDEDDETSFTNEVGMVAGSLEHGFPHAGDPTTGMIGIRYEHHNLSDGKADDVPSTDAVYPDLFAAGDGHDSFWLTLGVQYDLRDSDHQPYRGWNIDLKLDIAAHQTDYDPAVIATLTSTYSLPIPSFFHDGGTDSETNPPTDSIAVGGFIQSTGGDLPFYLLPSLGGPKSLRGYISNRFVDYNVWHLSAEWRTWVVPRGISFTDSIRIERIGLALFADVGGTSRHPSGLFSGDTKYSYGLGVRWAFERTAVFRTDFAISDEDKQFIANFGLSF